MKVFFPLLFVLAIGFTSCKKDKVESDFDKSYDAWQSFKKSSGNNYVYVVTNGSWIGTVDSTTITVSNGIVINRNYRYYVRAQNGSNKLVLKEEWIEGPAQINIHERGAAGLTLDEVYTKAKKEWLKVNEKDNEIYFEAKNNGMISLCGYVPKGCMDDCFNGISIASIEEVNTF
ncbi:hypothetical protein EOD41_19015 [Mucilaginibacter limnophilus]|uniref:Uncharacterized protein n=1 Tax=Mucilaginibacter limnophilus TaxID=1932778 RepID=A0A3S2WVT4_9SPHI|nr:hypothetical protein [Mucilaginibacter limnophilus]RVT97257.1 hypothetical protein EOD41_19015 [Mucilaginibacter limnophilus]